MEIDGPNIDYFAMVERTKDIYCDMIRRFSISLSLSLRFFAHFELTRQATAEKRRDALTVC